jgi:hypothetical protein
MRRQAATFFLFFLTTSAQAQNFQIWNELDLTASWRNIDFLVPILARTELEPANLQLVATGVTADLALSSHLTLTGGYLFAALPQRSTQVHIPLIALSLPMRLGRFKISDRNRFEKLIGYGASPFRYRNRVSMDRFFGVHDRWHLFANDEIFFDLSARRWSQNRSQAGGGTRLNPVLFVDFYYLLRSGAGGAPRTPVLGSTLRIALGQRASKRADSHR